MRTALTGATLIALALTASACIPLPGGYALSSKVVYSKSGSSTLHADDGSFCRVSDKQFADATVGDLHTCAWGNPKGGGEAGRTGGVPGRRQPPVTSKPPQ